MSNPSTIRKLTELKKAIKAAGLTQAWTARQMLNITPGYLGSVLKGTLNPSSDLLLRIESATQQLRSLAEDRAVS